MTLITLIPKYYKILLIILKTVDIRELTLHYYSYKYNIIHNLYKNSLFSFAYPYAAVWSIFFRGLHDYFVKNFFFFFL